MLLSQYRPSLSFVMVYLLLPVQELMPFAKIYFSQTFLSYFDLLLEITFGPFWSAVLGVMPLENLLGPVGDLYCFSNTFRMLVYLHFENLKNGTFTLKLKIWALPFDLLPTGLLCTNDFNLPYGYMKEKSSVTYESTCTSNESTCTSNDLTLVFKNLKLLVFHKL